MPLVSIYIPTKNRPSLLLRAIRSVLTQTYKNFEIIVVDDGSDRAVESEIIEKIGRHDSLRFIRNAASRGACQSRNIAIDCAKGKLVTGLDDDDYFHPRRLEMLINAYDPSLSLVTSNFTIIRKGGKREVSSFIPRTINGSVLFTRNCIGNQALFERSRVVDIGGYDESLSASQDLDLWVRLINKYGDAKRIRPALYYMDTNHDLPRITLSEARIQGTQQFLVKHSNSMTRKQYMFKRDYLGVGEKVEGANKYLIGPFKYGVSIGVEMLRNKVKLG